LVGIGGVVALKFQDDDAGYLQWVAQHASGFVLNCERHPKPDYLTLHAVSCHSITGEQPADRHWTMKYIKVCADDVADIEAWVRATVPAGTAWPCPICSPLGRAQ
jgi:hypothetical protein